MPPAVNRGRRGGLPAYTPCNGSMKLPAACLADRGGRGEPALWPLPLWQRPPRPPAAAHSRQHGQRSTRRGSQATV